MTAPELEQVTDSMARDKEGETWYKREDGRWEPMADVYIRVDRSTDTVVRQIFDGALENDDDRIEIRSERGRLLWRKPSPKEIDLEWKELTPHLAERIESGLPLDMSFGPVTEDEEPKRPEHKIGWYQDIVGNLYQYSGTEWVGTIPAKAEIDKLEFLG